MKHKITVLDQEKINQKSNEQEIFNEITKTKFFKWMEEKGYNYIKIKDILDGKKIASQEQSDFNQIIKKNKLENNISITEAILFLEENFVRFSKILLIIDDEVKFELKKELAEKYKIKIDENLLHQILG